jgi:hypothetical protein
MILSSTAAAGIPPTPEKLLPPLPPTWSLLLEFQIIKLPISTPY